MYPHGRYLKFRHVMPELFGPGVQARRGLLRLRWFLLQRLDFRPIWTLGAAAGLGGVLLTVALFFLQGTLRPLIAAREPLPRVATLANRPLAPAAFVPAPAARMVSPWIPPAPTSAATLVPQFPTLPTQIIESLAPYLSPEWSRMVMPFGWDDRRPVTVYSVPQAMEPAAPYSIARNDQWRRPSFRGFTNSSRPQSFVPYREPVDLRWTSVTPDVRYSSVVSSVAGVTPISRPYAIVEKQMPANFAGEGPLQYRLVVRNPSNSRPLPDVSVFEAVDVNRVTAVDPPARVEPTGLVWKLAGLAPGEQRVLSVSVWTEGLTQLAAATEIELADRVSALVRVEGQTEEPFFERAPVPAPTPAMDLPAFPRQSDLPAFPTLNEVRDPTPPPPTSIPSFPTSLPSPSPAPQPQGRPLLKLTAEPPSAVAVGEDATTWYEIENIGDAPATNIVLRLRLSSGLQHHDGSQDVEFGITQLEPGEKRRARLVTRATSHGLYDVSGQLTSGAQQEETTIQLFAPQRESVAGEAEPATDSRRSNKNNCNCTLLVRQTTVAAHR
ncbi:MAG: hypothetical protein ACK5Q5_08140 [Planctomycetaceae bacterium]